MKNDEKDIKDLSMDFLICCYFGQSKDLCKAAVDRAYVDMAAHTLHFKDNDNYDEKWGSRLYASIIIVERVKDFKGDFTKWHGETIEQIKQCYEGKLDNDNDKNSLTEGQAQKWLNMTIKYLFVLKELLGEDDDRFSSIKYFFENTTKEEYRMPIDSYILKEKNYKKKTWSTLEKDDYDEVMQIEDEKNSFMWELENWEKAAGNFKTYDKKSYDGFIKNKKIKRVQ